MNKTFALAFCLIILIGFRAFSQNPQVTPKVVKYGKISPEEFNTKLSGVDSAAAGVALFDIGSGWFEISAKSGGLIYVMERHTRYKIINKNGYDLANIEIQLYRNNGAETSLDYMDAATYNMEAGQMQVSKINKDAKFSEKQNKNYTLKKFTLPNVKEGSVIEFKYRIKSDFIFTLRPWYFQKEVPVLYSEYKVRIPEYLKYKQTAGGYVFLNPTRKPVNESFNIGTDRIEANSQELRFIAENVPGLKSEAFITTLEDYVSKIEFELSSTQYPGAMYKDYTETWPKIMLGLKNDENFGGFISKRGYNKTLAQSIIKTEKNQDSILNLIFNYVKNNIKWNDEHRLYTSATTPKAIFEKKSGSSAEINLCLYALLNEAGISVSTVLLSTRENGRHPGGPMLTKFDNVIVQATIGDKSWLLDATDKNHTPDIIGYDNLNHEGFKISTEFQKGAWIPLECQQPSKRSIALNLVMDKTHQLSGSLFISSSNYEGLQNRKKYQTASNEADYLKSFKTKRPGLNIKNYQIANLMNPAEPLAESMDVQIEDYVEEAGNLAYFTPLLFERTKENPFKLEDRKFPVDFGYPSEEHYRITIQFPEGYQLDKLPKSEKFILPDEAASFSIIVAAEGQTISLYSKIITKKSVYSAEEYYDLKALFKSVVARQAEQIVLKKI
jgi:hypothetical protein